MKIQNFGRNVEFSPEYFYEPKSEQEVLDILERHKNGQVRVVGSGHAWNPGIQSEDAFLEIKKLDSIKLNGDVVEVSGGVKLKNLIKFVTKRGFMLPAMGGIMEQSVAGLASTGTHGTGNSSFSHFIQSMRVAGYDENRNPKIFEYSEGDKLKAVRTSLGCMGVIVSMKIKCVPRYFVREESRLVNTLSEVLANEKEWPLGQSVIIPYSWKFFIFGRKKVDQISFQEKLEAKVNRFADYFNVEILPHVVLKMLLVINIKKIIIGYYKSLLPKLIFSQKVVNEDYVGLTLHTKHHYYFRHVEMETFTKESKILEVFELMKNLVEWFSGTEGGENLEQKYKNELKEMKGKFVLHYPMFIRKVYPDETLISMTAGDENYYAIGFFTYKREKERGEYYLFTKTISRILARDFDVRIHWGKHFPLSHEEVGSLYPEMEKFKSICREVDPNGVFQNDFTKKIFGF